MIMNDKTYTFLCPTCKKKTEHTICKVNIRKGARLRCLNCFKEKSRYVNLITLETFVTKSREEKNEENNKEEN